MDSEGLHAVDFRKAQHRNWDSAAVGWMEWSEFNDRADRHVSERLVELAGVREGSRVLDVAAGYGEPALTAAREVGREGHVVATDISAEMLAFAYVRAIAAPIRAMIEQHAGGAQEEAWDAITQAATEAGGGWGPLRLPNAVLLASGTNIAR
jgi:cyclopropane fatty-acyl-phospholipid synthase-like methyltransferase